MMNRKEIKKANAILTAKGINWTNYFDLPVYSNDPDVSWAVKRIKLFIVAGI